MRFKKSAANYKIALQKLFSRTKAGLCGWTISTPCANADAVMVATTNFSQPRECRGSKNRVSIVDTPLCRSEFDYARLIECSGLEQTIYTPICQTGRCYNSLPCARLAPRTRDSGA